LTYAPDNYDRTLMKLPSDDASKIFAGMKSDSDVVMTPDYAKKVFRSKSSAQRMQHYRLYTGIAAIILIGIAIFGLFEFTGESDNIDASLMPLRRDPMPGIIPQAGQPESQNLFAGTEVEVDERTIEIIENADSVATEGSIAGAVDAGEVAEVETVAIEPEIVVASVDTVKTRTVEAASNTTASQENAASNEPEAVEMESAGTASNLQVSSSTQVEEKDILLREAYSAYRAGDNELAMTRYNQVIKLDPGNRNALLARAAINVQNGNSSAAIRDYQALLLANPKDSLAMTSFISVASIAPQDSETQLKLMIQNEPDSPYLNFALANAYSAQNRWPEAQGYYFRALQANPGDPNYAYNLAVSLEHISQPASAVSYYQKALDNFENGLATFNRDVVSQRMELLAKK
jgi:tetratricopeptide (TPR) repeat protein